jgi:hypothetical protein
MNYYTPNVSSKCEVHGRLAGGDARLLSEDMVDIVLPNGLLISAGWYPEGDPNGGYLIAVTSGFDVISEANTANPHSAIEIIEELAESHMDPMACVAASGVTLLVA